MTKNRIHLIYSIVLSVALVIAGVCLIVACVGIYQADSFSREAVATAFQAIDIPVYISLVLILGGIVLDLFLPVETKNRIEKQDAVILQRQLALVDLQYCPPHLRAGIQQQEKNRKIHKAVTLCLLGVCSAGFLEYGLNIRNFPLEGINSAMVKAMWFFIPCLAVPFGYGIFTAYYCRYSIRKELALVKQARADGCPAPAKAEPSPATKSHLPIVKTAIVFLAIGILLFGLFTGGVQDVLTKAVNICTECVGLG